MTDGIVQVAPDSTGKKVDTSELTVSAQTVERQRIVVADDTAAAGVGKVQNVQPGSGDYGLTVRSAGDVNVVLNATAMTAAATLGTWDTAGYQSFNIQVTGAFTATLVLEISDDNTNWSSTYFFNSTASLASITSTSITASLSNGFGPIRARYLRARVSSFTSNTSSAVTLVLRTVNQYPEFINTNVSNTSLTVIPGFNLATLTSAATSTSSFVKSAATTNATSLKASAGNVFSIYLINNSAAVKYFKLYNKASAPTVGTDTPVAVVGIPASGNNFVMDGSAWAPLRFSTGIAYAITGAVTDADTTAVAVNDVSGWVIWA
jgi:hypothetical protein